MPDKFLFRQKYIILIMAVFMTGALLLFVHPGSVLPADKIKTVEPSYTTSDNGPDYLRNSNIPEFYKSLSKVKGDFSIIEYPAIVQDRYDPTPYYQRYHSKKILRGYFLSHALKKEWNLKKILKAKIWPYDIIFSRLEIKKIYLTIVINLFKDIIDMYDINSIRDSKARYIVLHKNIMADIISLKGKIRISEDYINDTNNRQIAEHVHKTSLHFKSYYERYFGTPVYEDNLLIVFHINKTA